MVAKEQNQAGSAGSQFGLNYAVCPGWLWFQCCQAEQAWRCGGWLVEAEAGAGAGVESGALAGAGVVEIGAWVGDGETGAVSLEAGAWAEAVAEAWHGARAEVDWVWCGYL